MPLADILQAAAARYGVDPAYLSRSAQIESNNNPNAANPNSSAKGLFQFIDGTAQQYGLANPFDPAASADAAARLARDNAATLRSGLGRDPTPAELYLAHQQGGGGALKLLQNPTAPAVSLVGMKAIRDNGGRPDMSAGDFASLWLNKYSGGGGVSSSLMTAAAGNPASPSTAATIPFAMAEPPAQPKKQQQPAAPKQRGLDLAKLFQDLSPQLVMGSA